MQIIAVNNSLKTQQYRPTKSEFNNKDLRGNYNIIAPFNNNSEQISFNGGLKNKFLRTIFNLGSETLDDSMLRIITTSNSTSERNPLIIARAMTSESTNAKRIVEPGAYTRILVQKIKNTEDLIRTQEEKINKHVKSAAVIEAESKISFYNSWNDAQEKNKYEQIALAAKQKYLRNTSRLARIFRDADSYAEMEYEIKMAPYWDNHEKYEQIGEQLHHLEKIVEEYYNARSANSDYLNSLRREQAAYRAELASSNLSDFINYSFHPSGGINDRIAGYDKIKEQIKRTVISPLIHDNLGRTNKLPSAIILYGATGVGKTEILRGIEQECAQYATVVNFPITTDVKDFQKKLKQILQEAQKRYQDPQNSKRTILLINEAEKYMCMTPERAERLCLAFQADDFDVLDKYGRVDTDNVNYLKSLLDNISEVPSVNDPTKSATTLFITTNYPHLIDQDLMLRQGKLTPIAVKPAANGDLKAVIQHYFKVHSELLESIKAASIHDNFENILGSQLRISPEAIKVLVDRRKNDTLKNLFIDYKLSDWKNVPQFLKFANPSARQGAYSNVAWKTMIMEAFNKYLENPEKPLFKHFFDIKSTTPRDITPKRYEQFRTIHNIVNDQFENKEADSIHKTFTDLINEYQNGELDETASNELVEQMERMKKEFDKLKKKYEESNSLSPGEQMKFNIMKGLLNLWNV